MPKDLYKTTKGKRIKKTPEEIAQEQQGGQEYVKAYNQAEATGFSTNPTKIRQAAIQGLNTQADLTNPEIQARLKLEQQAAEANVTQALLQQEIAKQNQTSQTQTSQNPLSQPSQAQEIMQPQPSNQEIKGGLQGLTPSSIKANIAKSQADIQEKGAIGAFVGQGGEQLARVAKSAAEIIDTIRGAITGQKETSVKIAEAGFTDASAVIQKDIELVKAGAKSYSEVDRDFRYAEASINDLEATTKGVGILNLRYWLSNGKEIEAQILREKQILQNQRFELDLAKQTAQLNKAKASFGIPAQ